MTTGDDITGPPRLPQNAASRVQDFSTGITGDDPQNAAGVSSIDVNSALYNSLVPHQFEPGSILQQTRPSMNGESAADYARVLPGGYRLPNQNGQSASSWEASNYLRMQGQDAQ